jgi:hypothetical protein
MMTPKEEAIELINKMYDNMDIQDGDLWKSAKQCALVTVNKLIKVTGSKHYYDVKKELEKL